MLNYSKIIEVVFASAFLIQVHLVEVNGKEFVPENALEVLELRAYLPVVVNVLLAGACHGAGLRLSFRLLPLLPDWVLVRGRHMLHHLFRLPIYFISLAWLTDHVEGARSEFLSDRERITLVDGVAQGALAHVRRLSFLV